MDFKYFDDCSAPMCPKYAGVEHTAWFPDEPVCRLLDVPEWVKRQRRIAKKATGGSFTLAMLQRDCRIVKVKGIDPDGTDNERAEAETAWLKAHPAITETELEIMRARGEKQKAVLSRFRSEKQGQHQGLDDPSGKNRKNTRQGL